MLLIEFGNTTDAVSCVFLFLSNPVLSNIEPSHQARGIPEFSKGHLGGRLIPLPGSPPSSLAPMPSGVGAHEVSFQLYGAELHAGCVPVEAAREMPFRRGRCGVL